jgi:hypothetical protein
MRVVRITGQAAADFHGLRAPREDCDAVPAFLPVPDRAIPGGANGTLRKILVGRFQFPKAAGSRPPSRAED